MRVVVKHPTTHDLHSSPVRLDIACFVFRYYFAMGVCKAVGQIFSSFEHNTNQLDSNFTSKANKMKQKHQPKYANTYPKTE